MTRALWKGAISFGLVNIPVDLYPAEDRKAFQFAMLDSRDLSPVGYKRFNKKTGKEVSWEAIVKGFEYEKGRFVVLSDEDFRRANVKATQTIDIQAFVPQAEIPAEYFDSPYFVAPSGKGQKAYTLLRETLRAAGRVAVAQVVIRTTQHLAAVVVQGRALMLDHAPLCRRAAASHRSGVAGRGHERRRRHAKGNRSRQASDRRHDKALESRRIQGHLSPRPHGAHQGKDRQG